MLAQTTSSSITNVCPCGDSESGSAMNRGSTAGTLTRANRVRPWKATVTATFMLRLARNGSGRPGLERERRQHRRDLAREHAGQVRRDVRRSRPSDRAGECRRRSSAVPQVVPDVELVAQHPPCARLHGGQLLLGVVAVGRHLVGAGVQLLERRRHPDHEELVEVRRRDGEELHAFEQRVGGVARLIEHALVELEPAQLTVDIQRRIAQVGRRDVSRWNGDERQRPPGAGCGDEACCSGYRRVRRRGVRGASRSRGPCSTVHEACRPDGARHPDGCP